MFKTFRENIGYYILNKKAQKVHREAQFINLDNAKRIGIIANLDSIEKYKTVFSFIDWLHEQKKLVYIVSFIDNEGYKSFFPRTSTHLFFSKKNITWFGKPKNLDYKNFIDQPFDILIDTSLKQILPFHYLVALSKARFKIGRHSAMHKYYDFTIDLKDENEDIHFFIEQIKHYLQLINKPQ
jgi:hypothetical protein